MNWHIINIYPKNIAIGRGHNIREADKNIPVPKLTCAYFYFHESSRTMQSFGGHRRKKHEYFDVASPVQGWQHTTTLDPLRVYKR